MKTYLSTVLCLSVFAFAAMPAFGWPGGIPGAQDLDPFNKNSAINKAGVRLNDVPPFKRHPPQLSYLSNGQFRSGAVQVVNDYGGDVQIRLYHPQGGGRVFDTWNFRGNQRGVMTQASGAVVVGSDWRIQIVFGNGVASPVRTVGNVAGYDGQTFVVDASRIFGG